MIKSKFGITIEEIIEFIESYNKNFMWLRWGISYSFDKEMLLIRFYAGNKAIQRAFIVEELTTMPLELIKEELDYTINELQIALYKRLYVNRRYD